MEKDETQTGDVTAQQVLEEVGVGTGCNERDQPPRQETTTNLRDVCVDELIDEKQLAERFKISRRTVQSWRSKGSQDLEYEKIGRNVRYRMSEVLKFERNHRHKSTSEY